MNTLLEMSSGGSVIGDIYDFLKSAIKSSRKGNYPQASAGQVYLNGSISNKTKQLVMTFPVLCDNSLPPATASMINRANERNIVTMLQLLFASISVEGKDGAKIISQIHKNINSMGMDDLIDAMDDFVANQEGAKITGSQIAQYQRLINEQAKLPQKSFPISSFSSRSLNEYSVYNIAGKTVVREDIGQASNEDLDQMTPEERKEYYEKLRILQMQNQINSSKQAEQDRNQDRKQAELDRAADRVRSAQQFKLNQDNTNQNMQYQVLTKQLLDTDIKKANEMTPTLMIVQFNEVDGQGRVIGKKSFIAGVKSRLISVDSTDIIDRVIVKNKTKINLLNLIRATTGEIGFIRDFLLCIDQAKIDAKNSVKKGEAAKMWKTLENRSTKNFYNKNRKSGNDASAITTLVINQETVNILKKNYNFDVEKISNAKMLLDAYNLLGIIIADESIEVVKFLYAGNSAWEQQAFSFLEKESNDNSYKKVINLIGKMNRG